MSDDNKRSWEWRHLEREGGNPLTRTEYEARHSELRERLDETNKQIGRLTGWIIGLLLGIIAAIIGLAEHVLLGGK